MTLPFILIDNGTTMTLAPACGQQLTAGQCDQPAVRAFLWPGQADPSPACARHINQARGIAHTMGFVLHELELPEVRSVRYADDPLEGTAARARLIEVDE